MSDDPSTDDPATIGSVGANCARCGQWVPASDEESLPAAMDLHMTQQHYGPWPA